MIFVGMIQQLGQGRPKMGSLSWVRSQGGFRIRPSRNQLSDGDTRSDAQLMSDPVTRLNSALQGSYRIEREIGEGGMATLTGGGRPLAIRSET